MLTVLTSLDFADLECAIQHHIHSTKPPTQVVQIFMNHKSVTSIYLSYICFTHEQPMTYVNYQLRALTGYGMKMCTLFLITFCRASSNGPLLQATVFRIFSNVCDKRYLLIRPMMVIRNQQPISTVMQFNLLFNYCYFPSVRTY